MCRVLGAGSGHEAVLLIVAMSLVCCVGGTGMACAGQFRFKDLERYYLRFCLAAPSEEDAARARLGNYAVQYTEKHCPIGSSTPAAVSALTRAGAKCSPGDDPLEPPAFVCDWSRPDYGLDCFRCQIDWIAVLVTDKKYVTIQDIRMSCTESGP